MRSVIPRPALIASPFERSDVYFSVVAATCSIARRCATSARRPHFVRDFARRASECRGAGDRRAAGSGAQVAANPERSTRGAHRRGCIRRQRCRPGISTQNLPANGDGGARGERRANLALTTKTAQPRRARSSRSSSTMRSSSFPATGCRIWSRDRVFADQPISEMLGDRRDGIVLKTQTAAGRKRLRIRRRISGGRGRHARRAAAISSASLLRRRQNRRFG